MWRPWAWILRVALFVAGVQVRSHPNPVLLLPLEGAAVATSAFVCMLPTVAAVALAQIPQNCFGGLAIALPTSYPRRPLPSP